MAQKLSDYSKIADNWGSRPLTVQLLRSLLSLTEPVRSTACGVLVESYRGQYDCLRAMAEDASESPQLRQWALAEWKQRIVERQLLLEDLKDPARLAYMDWAQDSRRRLREEFQTFLLPPDAILHARACAALKRYYPWDAEPRCSEATERVIRQ